MTFEKDRSKEYCNQRKNKVYLLVYEAEEGCSIPWSREKSEEGFFFLLCSFLLMVGLCMLCYDLIVKEPEEGVSSPIAPLEHMHYNTSATTPSTPPVLVQREYWL